MKPKKRATPLESRYKRAPSLGRSPLTGAVVLKSASKGASRTFREVRMAVRALKSVAPS